MHKIDPMTLSDTIDQNDTEKRHLYGAAHEPFFYQ